MTMRTGQQSNRLQIVGSLLRSFFRAPNDEKMNDQLDIGS